LFCAGRGDSKSQGAHAVRHLQCRTTDEQDLQSCITFPSGGLQIPRTVLGIANPKEHLLFDICNVEQQISRICNPALRSRQGDCKSPSLSSGLQIPRSACC